MVEIAKPIGQLESNIVTERIAGMDAEQHMQTLTSQLQTLTRNPTNQAHGQLTGLIDTMVWGKPRKLDASAKGGQHGWKPVMLSYIGQLDRNQMNTMKNSAASETPVMNFGLTVGPQQDSSSTLHRS